MRFVGSRVGEWWHEHRNQTAFRGPVHRAAAGGRAGALHARALSTRGPRKNCLRATPPSASKDVEAFAAWHGFRAARHASQWGYLPNDCGVAGMVMYASDKKGNAAAIFEGVYDCALQVLNGLKAVKP